MRSNAEIILSALESGRTVTLEGRKYRLFKKGDRVQCIRSEGEVQESYWLGMEVVVQSAGSADYVAYVGSQLGIVEFLNQCYQVVHEDIVGLVASATLEQCTPRKSR